MMAERLPCVVHYPSLQENPYSRLLVASLADVGVDAIGCPAMHHTNPFRALYWVRGYEIVHWHWMASYYQGRNAPRFFLRTLAFAACLLLIRLHGTSMVITVHNLYPHEHTYPRLHGLAARLIGLLVDQIIVHSRPAAVAIQPLYRQSRKTVVVEHVDYSSTLKKPGGDRLHYKRTLGLDVNRPLALFFGQIRPYKGVEWILGSADLLDAFGIDVLIAGSPIDSRYRDQLAATCENHANVQCRLEFIPDDDLSDILRAADVVVFPYTNALTSGAAHLALAHEVGIVAPRCTAFEELIDLGICVPIRDLTNTGLVQAVDEALKVDRDSWLARNREYLQRCSKTAVGQRLADIYRAQLARK